MQPTAHIEVELKLRVPPDAVDAVEAELRSTAHSSTAVDIDLDAYYVDTADWRLSGAGFAWRMRREGTRWVQALKARVGTDDTSRFEHEVDAGDATDGTPPPLDARRHLGTDVGTRFVDTIDRLALEGLVPSAQFRVTVHRVERVVTNGFGTVAVALDRGAIVAGPGITSGASISLSLDVCEVEFELVDGTVDAVHSEAAAWAGRHGLVADLPNKARRGRALADAARTASGPSGDTTSDSTGDTVDRTVGGTGPTR